MIILKSSSLRCSIFQTRHINWKSWQSRNREKVLRLEKLSTEEIWLRKRKIIIQRCKVMIQRMEQRMAVNEERKTFRAFSIRGAWREGTAWLVGIVATTKEKGSCTRTRGGQSLGRSLNWPTTTGRKTRERIARIPFPAFPLEFLAALMIRSPRMNPVWIFIIKENRLSFSSIFSFFNFLDPREEKDS